MNLNAQALRKQLLEDGARPDSFSIDDPEDFRLNLACTDQGYSVWFQGENSRWDEKNYTNLGEAVYEFATRLLPTQDADALAARYKDPDLKIYS